MVACLFGAVAAHADAEGAVFTMTNATDGNKIVVFSRDANGILTKSQEVATGGNGAGGGVDPLGSQGSLLLSNGSAHSNSDGEWLFAVNAGSNDISVFRVNHDGVELQQRIGSGGIFPVSLTVSDNTVYVLNDGAPANISGFKLDHNGHLAYISGSTRSLGDGAFGQVAFSPKGDALVVTDKANSKLLVFPVHKDGLPTPTPVVSASSGNVPFGVTFDKQGHLLAVEAGSNAVSSYNLNQDGSLQTITASAANGQKATCWIVVNQRGDIITSNPGTQSLSTFHVEAATGQVSLRNATAAASNGCV